MALDELVIELCEKLESTDPDLIRRIRASWVPKEGTLDADAVTQLLERILTLLATFDDDSKREAYNELAASEGIDGLDDDEVDFDFWIHEALLDPVLDELLETNSTEE